MLTLFLCTHFSYDEIYTKFLLRFYVRLVEIFRFWMFLYEIRYFYKILISIFTKYNNLFFIHLNKYVFFLVQKTFFLITFLKKYTKLKICTSFHWKEILSTRGIDKGHTFCLQQHKHFEKIIKVWQKTQNLFKIYQPSNRRT